MTLVRRATLLLLLLFPTFATARPPNIVFILADDLGQRDLGCYGSKFYETPNIDALAKQGMRFTDAYAACNVCSPTRAAIMTGKYPARLHLTDWLPGRKDMPSQKLKKPAIQDHLSFDEVTLPQALKEGGYMTGFFGKWHLGGPAHWPDKHGFDLNVAGCGLGHPPSYFSPYKIPTLPDGPKDEYLTDRLTDEAIKFIEASRDKPFLCYLSHYAVHNPQQAKPELIAKFKEKAAKLPPSPTPEFASDLGRKVRQVQNHPVYAANLASLDESVGRVLATIARLGLENDTIVIFTSDNGGLSTAEGTPTSNVPLRMGKGWNYEGGLRVPLVVKAPGVTKADSTCIDSTISTDFYPTLLELTGLPLRPKQHLDGQSIAPLLKGENAAPDRPLFWHYPHYSNQGGGPGAAIRLGEYKLVEWFEDDRVELYNVREDLSERADLATKIPDKARQLRDQLHTWQKSVDASFPAPNPDYDPKAKP